MLEVGSFYPPGYEDLCDRRKEFPGAQYVGCDLRNGSGVDRIEDAQRLSFPDNYFGTVILLEILEHVPSPESAIAEALRVLMDGGLLLVSVPFNYRLHGFPHDYRRFTSSGLHTMLEGFRQKTVVAIGPKMKPATVFAVAAKGQSASFSAGVKRFEADLRATSKGITRNLYWAALEQRMRELIGLLLGRAEVSISFYDPSAGGGYAFVPPEEKTGAQQGRS